MASPFGGDDLTGRVIVAGRRGALGAVDASDDGGQRQGNGHRQIADRLGPGKLKPLPEGRQTAAGRASRSRLEGLVPSPPSPAPGQQGAFRNKPGSPGSRLRVRRDVPRQPPASRERRQDDHQRHAAGHGMNGNVKQGKKLMIASAMAASDPEDRPAAPRRGPSR